MSKQGTIIRWAKRKDAADLVKLNDEFNGVIRNVEEVQESLALFDELVAVAVMDDQIVGFGCAQYYRSFCYRELHGEITELYVSEQARQKGLATSLIALLEEGLRSKGVCSIKVLTGLTNEAAIRTYEKSGYQKDDAVMLQKTFRKHNDF